MDLLILFLEQFTGQDINQDGLVGRSPSVEVDNIIPVFHGSNVRVVDVPEPPPVEEGDRMLRLRPSARKIRKRVLWNYLLGAFMSGDWTRDGDAKGIGCQVLGITTKEHPDVKAYVKRWDEIYGASVWGLTGEENRPTLEKYLRSIGWTGTNGTERNERNGE